METQTRGLRDALGPNTEFIFLNGSFEARGPTDAIVEKLFGDTAPFFEWWVVRDLETEEKEDIEDQDGIPQGTATRWCHAFEGFDQAIESMDEKLNELGEFDLAVGFSQGAIMVTILSMWYHKKTPTKPWWKLVLCVCGVYPRGINVRELFEENDGKPILVPFPSIHVVGQKDSLYEESLVLKDMYTPHARGSPLERLLIEHDGGHKFPSPERHTKFYADLADTIWQFFTDIHHNSVARL
uniref:Serine hydrolase domain-containing protein n=1 Tax=Hyaloperonospora arabidopsidis (strain Emoy2) TaxID=559515 RepID=M4BEE6_HYAAE